MVQHSSLHMRSRCTAVCLSISLTAPKKKKKTQIGKWLSTTTIASYKGDDTNQEKTQKICTSQKLFSLAFSTWTERRDVVSGWCWWKARVLSPWWLTCILWSQGSTDIFLFSQRSLLSQDNPSNEISKSKRSCLFLGGLYFTLFQYCNPVICK